MSFSWTIFGKDKKDLTKAFEIHSQALGLGPNNEGATDAPYSVNDIRGCLIQNPYANKLPEAAQDVINEIKIMVISNLNSLKPNHCDTCNCPETIPEGWTKESCLKFLSIPTGDVIKIEGGY